MFQRDGVIAEVGPFAELSARHPEVPVIGTERQVVLPGFVNGHHHIGLTPVQHGSPDMPLELWFVTRLVTRHVDLYLDTLYSAFEMIASGITTVQHLHGWLPGGLAAVEAGAGEVIRAYEDIGMRASYSDAHKTILMPYFKNFAPRLTVCCRTLLGRSTFAPGTALHAPQQSLPSPTAAVPVGWKAEVDLSLQISPVGDTTAREISAASQEVRDVLERLPGVERIGPQRVSAPHQTKGGLVDLLGGLALSVTPVVLKAVLQALQTVLSRQPPETKVLIQTKGGQVSFEFDPKRISLQELVSAAERLGASAPPA